jgi:GTP:adenosylcobinamide-phosphate guanylyltransferase
MAGKKVASHYIDQVVDIDTLQDFERAEAVLRKAEEGGNILG